VTLPEGDVIEYVNDPLGRRVAKKINLMRLHYINGRIPVSMNRNGQTYDLAWDQGRCRWDGSRSKNHLKCQGT